MEKYIISLDLGITKVKVALYNSKLEEINVTSGIPPGAAEHQKVTL